jgi:RND family efflux transporter MFP subunit
MRYQYFKSFVHTLLGLSFLLAISACREFVEAAEISCISVEVSGNVREVSVDVGDRIKKGQVLAVLDKRTYNLNVKAAEAELGRAKVQLADKRNDLDRFQRINKQDPGAVSQAALDQSQAAVDSALQNVQFTKSQLKLAKRDLDKTVLRAPFDGVIANRYIDAFNEVARGQKCFDTFELTGMEVAISIPEDAIDDIQMDQEGEIQFSVFADRTYHGKVTEISKVAGTANAFPIKLTIKDPDQRIRPGMTARVTLLLAGDDEKAAYLVPLSAIAQRGDTTKGFVYIYDSQTSTVKKTQIESGSVRGNDVVITGGIKKGDIIAVAGVSFLEDGQEVKLMEQQAEKKDFEIQTAE